MTTKAELECRIAELEQTVYEQARMIDRVNADLDNWKENLLAEKETRAIFIRQLRRKIDRLTLDPDYLEASER